MDNLRPKVIHGFAVFVTRLNGGRNGQTVDERVVLMGLVVVLALVGVVVMLVRDQNAADRVDGRVFIQCIASSQVQHGIGGGVQGVLVEGVAPGGILIFAGRSCGTARSAASAAAADSAQRLGSRAHADPCDARRRRRRRRSRSRRRRRPRSRAGFQPTTFHRRPKILRHKLRPVGGVGGSCCWGLAILSWKIILCFPAQSNTEILVVVFFFLLSKASYFYYFETYICIHKMENVEIKTKVWHVYMIF